MSGQPLVDVSMDVNALKKQAAEVAVSLVESGMVVGLGVGSTAIHAVRAIARRLQDGELHHVLGVPCALSVAEEARRLGIPLTTLEVHPVVDITIDGADEVDPVMNLIKGGGGALLREKIVAQASRREVIVVDESKLSPTLGCRWALPVEVIPFGWGSHLDFLRELGANPVLCRMNDDNKVLVTDQGNMLLDCHFGPMADPQSLGEQIKRRAGIVEHGLFLNLATDLIVAGAAGITHRTRDRF